MLRTILRKREGVQAGSVCKKENNAVADDHSEEKVVEVLDEEEVQKRFEQSKEKAKKLLEDRDKMDRFLERLERKLKHVPVVGGMLSEIPILIALVKAYIEKRYLDIPIGSIIAVVGALIYFLSPIDLMPDFLPAIGLWTTRRDRPCAQVFHDDVKEIKLAGKNSSQSKKSNILEFFGGARRHCHAILTIK
jgi:uncharacterized membrane protein YkvA (DUF1232 family)